jgi:hypothetical protein
MHKNSEFVQFHFDWIAPKLLCARQRDTRPTRPFSILFCWVTPCWSVADIFLSKDFELIQCLSDVITNLLCPPVFLYSMYESDRWSCQQCIFNWDVVCVQKLTNSTGLKWNILSNTTSCSWFCDSVTRTLFNWFSVASLMKTWIRHQLTISNVLP